jgi:hypothetical protein
LKKLLLATVFVTLGIVMGCADAKLPNVMSIAVNPATPSLAAGHAQQFTAVATLTNGLTRDLTSLVTWTSSAHPVSTITSGGFVQTYSAGTSTISASFTQPAGTVTGSTTLTVTAPILVSIVVTDASTVNPGPQSLKSATTAKGTGHQFVAYGLYSDGGERNITTTVTWTSAPLTAATITNAGRATGIAAGTATITATDPTTSITGSSSLVVTNATVTGIEVYPVSQTGAALLGQTIAPLTRIIYAALGTFSDGTTQDLTVDATWASTNPAAGTVSNSTPKGVATGVAVGLTQIDAVFGAATGTANLVVSAASPTSIALTPATSGVAIGSTLQLTATGAFSDGSKQTINLAVAWSVTPSNNSIATVDQTGLVTGVAAGSATVTAKIGAVTMNAVINVQGLTSMAITPTPVTIANGTQTQFVATATLADGTTQNVSSSVTWVSTGLAVTGTLPVATISDAPASAGWATGNNPGTANVAAVFDGVYASPQLTVTNATLTSLAIVSINGGHTPLGASAQYTATGTFSDSSTQNLTDQVAWSSSAPTVAVVNSTGLATTTGLGSTTLTAAGNINGNTPTSHAVLTVP